MEIAFDAQAARTALAQLPELAAQESLQPPDLSGVYVPAHHAKALHLDASVVVGMRGAGKSWWTAVLATSECLQKMRRAARSKLPPRRFTSDPIRIGRTDALIDDLVELAVLYRTKDGRLNISDIFRVGFGIRRRGGVKPPR